MFKYGFICNDINIKSFMYISMQETIKWDIYLEQFVGLICIPDFDRPNLSALASSSSTHSIIAICPSKNVLIQLGFLIEKNNFLSSCVMNLKALIIALKCVISQFSTSWKEYKSHSIFVQHRFILLLFLVIRMSYEWFDHQLFSASYRSPRL